MRDPLRFPRVKVCGITRIGDALAATAAGADAIGFVHHPPSPRSVMATAASRVAANLPSHVLPVGIFVDQGRQLVEQWCHLSSVRAVQLCGAEDPQEWRTFGLPILRRLPVNGSAEEELAAWRDVAWGFVLDHPQAPGGTGRLVDRKLAAALAEAAPCVLAGGLDAHNVREAISSVRPAGVDASSRLEFEPGRKDPERVRAYVAAALSAFQEFSQ